MSTDRHDPLDADERELARVLRALPAGEPPSTLDTRILAMARDAVVATPHNRDEAHPRRARRWVWGTGVAASCVLAAGLVWRLGGTGGDALDGVGMSAPQEVAAEAQTQSAAPIPAEAPATERAEVQAAKASDGLAEEAREQRSAPPAAPVAFAPELALAPAAFAAAPATAAEKAPATAAERPTLDSITVTGTRLRSGNLGIDDDARLGQQAWLDRIRWRIEQGDEDGAHASLQRFERQFPRTPVPADLAAFREQQ